MPRTVQDVILLALLAAVVLLVILIFFLLWRALRSSRTTVKSVPDHESGPADPTLEGKAARFTRADVRRAPVPGSERTDSDLKRGPPLLSIDGHSDAWTVQVRGHAYREIATIPDERLQIEVRQAVAALVRFAGARLPAASTAPRPSSPPSAVVAPAAPRREPVRPVASTGGMVIDFAEEIGGIIDELLAADPSLTRHVIDLQNRASGGLVFIVDGTIYRELSEIPYEDVRGLIRRATREWERR